MRIQRINSCVSSLIQQKSFPNLSISFSGTFTAGALESTLDALAQNAKASTMGFKKAGKFMYKNLSKGKIEVFPCSANPKNSAIVPEYLYHVTSRENMDKILKSGQMNISKNEQLQGIYFFDKSNFLTRYSQIDTGADKKLDCLSTMFQHAHNLPGNSSPQSMSVIKLPVLEMLNLGKFRVRTQEDFFFFKRTMHELGKKHGKKFSVREMCDEKNRKAFRDLMISSGEMTEKQVDDYLARMSSLLHQGYTLKAASDLSLDQKSGVEYIFNHPIVLSEINYKIKDFDILDFCEKNNKKLIVTPQKAEEILNF